ncbi:MAG: hypothetical protein VCF25_02460, partial [Candidatus Poribacteria bacterium]
LLHVFCSSFSRFRFHILNTIGPSNTGKDMHQIHELKDVPSDVVNTSLVKMLHLEASLHSSEEAFNFCA